MNLNELERIPVGEAHQRLRPVIDSVRVSHKPVVLTHHRADHVAIVPVDLLERLLERDNHREQ